MKIEDILSEVSKDGKIKAERINDNDIDIFIRKGEHYERILRIYPQSKTAEFLDIDEEWEELQSALEKDYKEFPGLLALTYYLNRNKYSITF